MNDRWGVMNYYLVNVNIIYYLWGVEFYQDVVVGIDDFVEEVFNIYFNLIKEVLII